MQIHSGVVFRFSSTCDVESTGSTLVFVLNEACSLNYFGNIFHPACPYRTLLTKLCLKKNYYSKMIFTTLCTAAEKVDEMQMEIFRQRAP